MLSQTSNVIKCTHPDYVTRDLRYSFDEFSIGSTAPLHARGSTKWLGAFQGRPLLFSQLLPVLRARAQGKRPRAIIRQRIHLRQFFRFLDQYEAWAEAASDFENPSKITVIADISPHHLLTWQTPPFEVSWIQDYSTYKTVTALITSTRANLKLPPMWIPSPQKQRREPVDVPDEKVGRELVSELAHCVNDIWSRWRRADELAVRGKNLVAAVSNLSSPIKTIERSKALRGCTEADLHATYRAFIAKRNGVPCDFREVLAELGYSDLHRDLPRWWPVYEADHPNAGSAVLVSDMLRGLYPTFEDVATGLLLLCGRTGWNPATSIALDTSREEAWVAKYSEKLVWMFAFKHRSLAWQDTLSWVKKKTGPYQLVVRFWERIRPLRAALAADPSLCSMPDLALRSPWVYARAAGEGQYAIGVVETDFSDLNRVLRRIIDGYNERNPQSPLPKIAPSDLRDVFAGAIYRKSGYSLFLTQIALGHKHSSTTFEYLRSRAFREESEKSKNMLVIAVFSQIQVHRKLDPTLLRAEMAGLEFTADDIHRLEMARKNRTYSGLGCSEPTNPPTYIDPSNPRDGSTFCRQGHRCAACPRGRVFNDSFQYLARRCAELEWLRETTLTAPFERSSASDDLKVFRATLEQWPEGEVLVAIQDWTDRINAGTHMPIRFAGEH